MSEKQWYEVAPANGKYNYMITEPAVIGAPSEPFSIHITADADTHSYLESLPYVRRAFSGLVELTPGVSRQWYWINQNYNVEDAWLATAYSIEAYLDKRRVWEVAMNDIES